MMLTARTHKESYLGLLAFISLELWDETYLPDETNVNSDTGCLYDKEPENECGNKGSMRLGKGQTCQQ